MPTAFAMLLKGLEIPTLREPDDPNSPRKIPVSNTYLSELYGDLAALESQDIEQLREILDNHYLEDHVNFMKNLTHIASIISTEVRKQKNTISASKRKQNRKSVKQRAQDKADKEALLLKKLGVI